MGKEEGQIKVPVWETAWKCLKTNMNDITTVGIVTAALRALVVLPLFLSANFGGKLPLWMCLVMSAFVYIAGVIPMRFWAREKMRRMVYSRHMNHHRKDVYKKWLAAGLLRYIRGCLWGLPFLAGLVYFTVFRLILDAQTFWLPIRPLAVLLGREPDTSAGFLAAMGLMAVFGLLFAYGWWRDLPMEYLPARSLGPVKTLHWSRRILKKYRKQMRICTLVNILLSLPAWIGLGAVLVPYAMKSVDFSVSPDLMFSQLLNLLRSRLPLSVLLMLGGVVLLLYVPFWALRKTRNTALIAQLMRQNDHTVSRHSHSSSSGSGTHSGSTPVEPKIVNFRPGLGNAEKKETPPPAWNAGEKNTAADAARTAREIAQMAQETAEQAANMARNAARIAQEAAQNKQE